MPLEVGAPCCCDRPPTMCSGGRSRDRTSDFQSDALDLHEIDYSDARLSGGARRPCGGNAATLTEPCSSRVSNGCGCTFALASYWSSSADSPRIRSRSPPAPARVSAPYLRLAQADASWSSPVASRTRLASFTVVGRVLYSSLVATRPLVGEQDGRKTTIHRTQAASS